jgi:hypothetical protein
LLFQHPALSGRKIDIQSLSLYCHVVVDTVADLVVDVQSGYPDKTIFS